MEEDIFRTTTPNGVYTCIARTRACVANTDINITPTPPLLKYGTFGCCFAIRSNVHYCLSYNRHCFGKSIQVLQTNCRTNVLTGCWAVCVVCSVYSVHCTASITQLPSWGATVCFTYRARRRKTTYINQLEMDDNMTLTITITLTLNITSYCRPSLIG